MREESAALSSSRAIGSTVLVKLASEGLMSFAIYSVVSATSHVQITLVPTPRHLQENETHLIQKLSRALSNLLRILHQAILRRREQRGRLWRRPVLRRRHAGVRDRSNAGV